MKFHLLLPGVLLCSTWESVLVHLCLPDDNIAVCLWVGPFPIICQLLRGAPHVKPIALLSFCHLINIYISRSRRPVTSLTLTTNHEGLANNTSKLPMKTPAGKANQLSQLAPVARKIYFSYLTLENLFHDKPVYVGRSFNALVTQKSNY